MNSIFDKFSLNRNEIKWEDYLYEMTPVEKIGNLFFKREDMFAPLGYGGVNGSKLRQCIWLVHEYINNSVNPCGVISGTSVKSPQLPMGSAVATHFGLNSIHVIGATKSHIAHKHENVAMATWFGARFFINPNIAYNPVLQRKVKDILEKDSTLKDYFYLEYGITVDHKINDHSKVERFHYVGSEQVKNIPDDINNIIIPSGSCNSCTSILYGIARFRPKNLKNIYLIGIGPNKIPFIEERLDIIKKISGIDTKIFNRNYVHSKKLERVYSDNLFEDSGIYNLHHHDLHSTKYINYQDEVPYSYEGLELHPTYEGKVAAYINDKLPTLWNEKTLFWIVGSKPRKENMIELLRDKLGEFPKSINEYKI